MLNWNKKLKFHRDVFDDEFIQWDLDEPAVVEERQISHPQGGRHLLPPSAVEHNWSSSVCSRYTHTSINKMRFPVTAVAIAPDGKRVITGASSGEFTLWNAQHFNFETILQAHDSAVRSMVFSHSDQYLLSGDNSGYVKYYEPNFNCVKVFQAHEQPLRQACFAPTDLKFVTCSDDGFVKIWDFVRGELDSKLEGHGWDVKAVDWHSSKALIASGGKDNKVKLWDPRTKRELATMHAHKQTVLGVKWNLNGNWLLTASRDQMAKLFDIRTMKELQLFRGHKREVTCCQWHPFHEGLFATGSGDGTVNFYHVGQEAPVAKIDQAHESSIWDMAWHPFGHEIATVSNDQLLRFWTRNRPSDKMEDKHNLSARQEANVDLSKLQRATHWPDELEVRGPEAAQLPQGLLMSSDASSVIPGMSSAQAKMRRMRPAAIAPSRPGATPTVEVRVMSYDMLAQINAVQRNFPDVSESLLSWAYRSQNLLLEVKQRNADVLCLQEVSYYREFWQQHLKGFQAAYQAHPDAVSAKCVVVMTRPQKLALRQAIQVRFSDEDQGFRSVAVIGVYETSASVALREKDSRAPRTMFIIASVSLSNYGNEDKQLEQANVLLAAIDRARSSIKPEQGGARFVNVNVIMAGNFNMVPGSRCYNLITCNAPNAASAGASVPHQLPLASAYGLFQGGREPAYTTVGRAWEGTTSYVFYSHPDVGVKELLEFPPKDLLGGVIPNNDYSSNNLALEASLVF
jgi:polyadenylation factor subunit 2